MLEKLKENIANYVKENRQKDFERSICDLLDSLALAEYDHAAFNDIVVNKNFHDEKNISISTSITFKNPEKQLTTFVLKKGNLLHCAAATGNLYLLDQLVGLGLDTNKVDANGKKALDYLIFPKNISENDKAYYQEILSPKQQKPKIN